MATRQTASRTSSRPRKKSRTTGAQRARRGKRWSRAVMELSDALDLEAGVFTKRDPRAIALSLRRSAEQSTRRKSDPYRSAMSMLTFYMNRAGRTLPAARLHVLERAKDELRQLYHRRVSHRR
jgi:hypothetical protein